MALVTLCSFPRTVCLSYVNRFSLFEPSSRDYHTPSHTQIAKGNRYGLIQFHGNLFSIARLSRFSRLELICLTEIFNLT